MDERLPLALYGSLRSGLEVRERLGVADGLRDLGACLIAGELYDLGEYPGLLPGPGRVAGELVELASGRVLAALDAYEGFAPGDPAALFVRERVRLLEPDRIAWVYRYNRPVAPGRRVPGGDWLAHLKQRDARDVRGTR